MTEAAGTIGSAFGIEWLNSAARDFSPSIALPFRRRHLGNLVATAGPEQIVEILELVEYLHKVHRVPGLDVVIDSLRTDYHSALMQLAAGARLMMVGAHVVEFEPKAAGGRLADLGVKIGSEYVRVECYRRGTPDRFNQEVQRLGMDVLRDLDVVRPIAVGVALHVPLTAAVRKEVVKAVRQGVHTLWDGHDPQSRLVPTLLLSGDIATISLAPTPEVPAGTGQVLVRSPDFPHQASDWNAYVRLSLAAPEAVTSVRPWNPEGLSGLSCVAVWLAPADQPSTVEMEVWDRITRLAKRIEKKLAQTRGSDGGMRVVIVETSMTAKVAQSTELQDHLRAKLIESRRDVAAIVLQARRWRDELGRHGYEVLPINGGASTEVVREVLRSYSAIDHPNSWASA